MPDPQETKEEADEFYQTDTGLIDPFNVGDESQEGNEDPEAKLEGTDQNLPPKEGSESPDDSGKESNNGQEGDPDEGQGDYEGLQEFLDTNGFKSIGDLKENYADKQRIANEQQSTLNTIEGKFAQMESRIDSLLETKKEEVQTPQLSDEQLTELLTEKPSEFLKVMSEAISSQIVNSKDMKDMRTSISSIQSESVLDRGHRVLNTLKTEFSDFKDYEPEIEKRIKNMGGDIRAMNGPALLLEIYKSVKLESMVREINKKKQKVDDGNGEVEDQAKKAAQLGKLKAGKKPGGEKAKDDPLRKVKTPVGEIAKQDMDLLYDNSLLSIKQPG